MTSFSFFEFIETTICRTLVVSVGGVRKGLYIRVLCSALYVQYYRLQHRVRRGVMFFHPTQLTPLDTPVVLPNWGMLTKHLSVYIHTCIIKVIVPSQHKTERLCITEVHTCTNKLNKSNVKKVGLQGTAEGRMRVNEF